MTAEPNWPTDKIARLVELRNEAKSSGQIAVIMKITRNAVIGKLSRMKLQSLNFGKGCKSMSRVPTPPRGIPSVATIMATAGRKPYGSGKKPVQAITQPPKLKTRPRLTAKPGKGKLMIDLNLNECRFAIDTDKQKRHLFCGAKTEGISSWCPQHSARVFKSKGIEE